MGKLSKTTIKLTVLMYLLILSSYVRAQQVTEDNIPDSIFNQLPGVLLSPLNCKKPRYIKLLLPDEKKYAGPFALTSSTLPEPKKRNFTINGDISYDGNYHSYIDTPFNEKNVWQHQLLLNVYLNIKNIPLQFSINTRAGNSAYYKNFSDIGFLFDADKYKEQIKEQLYQKISNKIKSDFDTALYTRLRNRAEEKLHSYSGLEEEIQVQKLIESREIISLYKQKLANKSINEVSVPSFNNLFSARNPFSGNNFPESIADSIEKVIDWEKLAAHAKKFIEEYDTRKKEAAAYRKTADSITTVYQQQKDSIIQSVEEAKQAIARYTSYRDLKTKLQELGISADSIPRHYKFLSGIKSVGIGRTIINYSELTLKNIAITGISAEYSNGIYIAFCGGAVDYRYRDFIITNFNMPRQNVAAFRIGVEKEKKSFVATFYKGNRIYSGQAISGNYTPVKNPIMGLSFEATYKFSEYSYLVAEMAKSTARYNPFPGSNASKPIFNFTDHTSEAYAVKIFVKLPRTNTILSGFYRYMGINFQSFSLYTNNSQSRQWSAKIDQQFFKRKLYLSAFIRNQGFENPYLPVAYSSNTIFKGITATLRLKRWPIVSVGYLPVTQLVSFNNQVQQINFQTVTATASYSRLLKEKMFTSTATYSRFFNTAADSGFSYYNASNISFSNTISGNKVGISNTVSTIRNNNFLLVTIDQGATVKLGNTLALGAGIKLNRVNNIENKAGGYGTLLFKIPLLGEFSFMYEYGYLPGYGQQQLIKNQTGRINYYRTF